uniref:Uncharacterized protein n=1 Tax=Arundo donax TaxID=35708 RepID=A0A0A9DMZ3_ARUDO
MCTTKINCTKALFGTDLDPTNLWIFLDLVISSSKNPWIWSCGQIEDLMLSHLILILE